MRKRLGILLWKVRKLFRDPWTWLFIWVVFSFFGSTRAVIVSGIIGCGGLLFIIIKVMTEHCGEAIDSACELRRIKREIRTLRDYWELQSKMGLLKDIKNELKALNARASCDSIKKSNKKNAKKT